MNHAKVSPQNAKEFTQRQRHYYKFQYMNAEWVMPLETRKEFGSKFEFYENNEFLAIAWCVLYVEFWIPMRAANHIIYIRREKVKRMKRWIHYFSTAAFCGIIIQRWLRFSAFSVILGRALTLPYHAVNRGSYTQSSSLTVQTLFF